MLWRVAKDSPEQQTAAEVQRVIEEALKPAVGGENPPASSTTNPNETKPRTKTDGKN
jgi:hypothetical protein